MELTEIIQISGLKEREAEAYLALLELGKATASQIAQKTGMQRPNCYAVLDSLVAQGIATLLPSEKRIYLPADPQKLAEQLSNKYKVFNNLLPQLRGLYQASSTRPRVQFYDGLDSLIELYDQTLQQDSYCCIYTPQVIDARLSDYVENFCKRVKEKDIVARDLVVGSKLPFYYAKYFTTSRQEVRMLQQKAPLNADMILTKERLLIVNYVPSIYALTIEDTAVIQTFQLMFESIWKDAK